jgi:hypothetical protein
MKKFFGTFGMPLLALLMMASFSLAQYGGTSGYTAPPTSFTGPITPTTGTNLQLNTGPTNTDQAGETVRINSITNTGTANSWIGFQSKPAQGASTAQNVIGGEISPRVNDTFALTGTGSIIGLHTDAFLRGTTGNIAGDVRGTQVELVTDDAATRTISGNVMGTRYRMAFSGTVTGSIVPLRVEFAEVQTNSKAWTAVMEFTGDQAGVWNDNPGTEPTTADGYLKIIVNGNARYLQLYSGAPVD